VFRLSVALLVSSIVLRHIRCRFDPSTALRAGKLTTGAVEITCFTPLERSGGVLNSTLAMFFYSAQKDGAFFLTG